MAANDKSPSRFDQTTFGVVLAGGVLLLLSYFLVFREFNKTYRTGYLDSKFWYGQSKNSTILIVTLQVLAAVGFLLMFVPWIFFERPQGGLLGSDNWSLPVVTGLLLLASIAWATFLYLFDVYKNSAYAWIVVLSLVVVAICSILLIVGAAQDQTQRWYVLLGSILFAITTVFADSVVWNSHFITANSGAFRCQCK